jgi:hypothetical protein
MFAQRPGDLLPDACGATGNQGYAAFEDVLFEVTHGASPPLD